jgi:PadR family transcriptional regulator PadR
MPIHYSVLLSTGTHAYYVPVPNNTEYWKEGPMGKQMTEMLKGTLEGIVLAILAVRPAYGYEITARLREQGFSEIAEGTVYALLIRIEQRGLVDVEKVPSEKGPPRKVYSLNAQGGEYLEEFWRTWSFLAGRIEQLHEGEQ